MVRKGLFLGYIISNKGIEVDKAKIDIIMNLPPPKSIKEVRGLFSGFYTTKKYYKSMVS
jgi:hypothetical protein